MTAGQFWELQQFSYLETYSFNRWPKLALLHGAAAIAQLEQQLPTVPFRDQRKLAHQLRTLQGELDLRIMQKPLTSPQGEFDVTAEKVAVVAAGSAVAQQLSTIFTKPAGQVVHFMCLPIYRDALAFYNAQGQLMRVLNICFECLAMRTQTGAVVEADVVTYESLGQLLHALGHPLAG